MGDGTTRSQFKIFSHVSVRDRTAAGLILPRAHLFLLFLVFLVFLATTVAQEWPDAVSLVSCTYGRGVVRTRHAQRPPTPALEVGSPGQTGRPSRVLARSRPGALQHNEQQEEPAG